MMFTQAVVAFSLLAVLWPAIACAQAVKAGVVTTLEGNVTAARTTSPQPVNLKFKDDVFVNDRVVTGDRSLARMLLGGKAVVTVRERSALTITEVPGRSTIDLDSGKIAVAVARDKMRPGEQIEVKTPNAVAAVRGTAFVVEVVRASADASAAQPGVTTNVFAFTAGVALTVGSQTLDLLPNTFASTTGVGVNTGPMTPQMRAEALGGLTPTGTQPVSGANDVAKDAAMGTTVSTFSTATALPTIGAALSAPRLTPPQNQTPPLLPGGSNCLTPTDPGCSAGTVVPTRTQLPSSPPPPTTKATGILLFGDTDLGESVPSRAAMESDLRALQPNVLITNLNGPNLPADLSAYGSIWHVGLLTPLSDADQTRLRNFLAAAGGVYLTGERPCCQALNNSIQSLLRSVVVAGGNLVVGSMRDFGFIASPFNPTARGGVTTTPNGLTSWFAAFGGELFGISGANVLATVGEAIVAGVWGEEDLVGNAGRLILMMDVDWQSNPTSLANCDAACRLRIIENFVTFLDDPPAPLVLAGPLFRSIDEEFSSSTSPFPLPGMTITTTGLEPLIWLSGTTWLTQGAFATMTDSAVATAGSYLRLDSGARIIQTGTDPLVSVRGGSLSVGTSSDGGQIFELIGREGKTQVDSETGLTIGTDRPIQPGAAAPVFEADNGASVTVRGNAYKIDTALLEATAPLLNLKGGSALSTTGHAVDLTGRAMLSIPNDAVAMVSLNASALTIANGHLVNVAGGSIVNVAGTLVSLSHGSTLNILNGLLVNVSGGSSASIGRSLVSFSGTGNLLNVNNAIVPTAIVGGIPVSGPTDSFRIGANALAGNGSAGTIRINGVPLTPSTPLSSLTGSLIAVQNGGSVKVGP